MSNDDRNDADSHTGTHGAPTWFEKPANVSRIVTALYIVCALLFVIDFVVHKHSQFAVEHTYGFYAWYGFVACVALVLAAKVMRVILMRSEDYYDR